MGMFPNQRKCNICCPGHTIRALPWQTPAPGFCHCLAVLNPSLAPALQPEPATMQTLQAKPFSAAVRKVATRVSLETANNHCCDTFAARRSSCDCTTAALMWLLPVRPDPLLPCAPAFFRAPSR